MKVRAQQREAQRLLDIADRLAEQSRGLELSIEHQIFVSSLIGAIRASAKMLIEASDLFIQTHVMLTGREPTEAPPELHVIDGGSDDAPPAA